MQYCYYYNFYPNILKFYSSWVYFSIYFFYMLYKTLLISEFHLYA